MYCSAKGKDILLNNTLFPEYEFHYQEHWIDLNIKEGNECDPDIFPKGVRKFVKKEKRDPLYIFKLLDEQSDLQIVKIDEKKYLFKYSVFDQDGEEFKQNSIYDLNFPLYMNPEGNGFKHKLFDYQSVDLSLISLCEIIENEEHCSEDQDLTFLLKR